MPLRRMQFRYYGWSWDAILAVVIQHKAIAHDGGRFNHVFGGRISVIIQGMNTGICFAGDKSEMNRAVKAVVKHLCVLIVRGRNAYQFD